MGREEVKNQSGLQNQRSLLRFIDRTLSWMSTDGRYLSQLCRSAGRGKERSELEKWTGAFCARK